MFTFPPLCSRQQGVGVYLNDPHSPYTCLGTFPPFCSRHQGGSECERYLNDPPFTFHLPGNFSAVLFPATRGGRSANATSTTHRMKIRALLRRSGGLPLRPVCVNPKNPDGVPLRFSGRNEVPKPSLKQAPGSAATHVRIFLATAFQFTASKALPHPHSQHHRLRLPTFERSDCIVTRRASRKCATPSFRAPPATEQSHEKAAEKLWRLVPSRGAAVRRKSFLAAVRSVAVFQQPLPLQPRAFFA